MQEPLSHFLDHCFYWVWGPLPLLLFAIGLFLTYQLRFLQFTHLPAALRIILGKDQEHKAQGDVTHFQSLMTALAATLGIGNIAGVATAITVGGFGAIVWMWVVAGIGMAIKYGEALLAVKFRKLDRRGEMCGGPMYFIGEQLKWKKLAGSFALFGLAASFGGGNILQANSVADVLESSWAIDPMVSGIVLACFVGVSLIGGIQSIGRVASILVPMMALLYVGAALVILALSYDQIPSLLSHMVHSAFSGEAAIGGFAGASILQVIQIGASRGMMTSEAGLGTASIAAAAAKTDEPCRQGLVSMTGAFLSTGVMCTITALVIGVGGLFGIEDSRGGILTGATLTSRSFELFLPGGAWIVAISLVLFAFTTLIGWAYYGEKCIEYLWGEGAIFWYRLFFVLAIVPGAILQLELVWKLSDIANGLMAFPNLLGLVALSSVIVADTRRYLHNEQRLAAGLLQTASEPK